MSGHITTMSRSSRVGSSSSIPSSSSRSTSTWRCRPWHACTCSDRSPAAAPGSAVSAGTGEAVLAEVALQPGEKRVAHTTGRSSLSRPGQVLVHGRPREGSQPHLQLARITSAGPQQRMQGYVDRRVVAAGDHLAVGPREPLPEHVRGVRQPEVHVAVLGERVEHLQLLGGQPGRPEDRQPCRQLDDPRLATQPCARRLEPLRRAVRPDLGADPSPELGLPGEVVVERSDRGRPCPVRRPSRAAWPVAARRTRRTARRASGPWRPGGPGPDDCPAGRRAGRGAARGWRTTPRCRTARPRRAAPTSAGARPTGRRGGRRRCRRSAPRRPPGPGRGTRRWRRCRRRRRCRARPTGSG